MLGNKENRRAFTRGFFKGLGAPVMLFGNSARSRIKPVPSIKLDKIISPNGFAKDAAALSGDLSRALDKTR